MRAKAQQSSPQKRPGAKIEERVRFFRPMRLHVSVLLGDTGTSVRSMSGRCTPPATLIS